MDIADKIIADLIKGAQETEGFLRGGSVGVEIGKPNGHEEKLAFDLSALLQNPTVVHGLVGAGLGGVGGALAGGEDHRLSGGLRGALAGGALSVVADHPAIQRQLIEKAGPAIMNNPVGVPLAIAGGLGIPLGAGALAGATAREKKHPEEKKAALSTAYETGVQAAQARFKVAFLGAIAPLLGSVAAGPLARAGLGKLAPRIAGSLGQGFKGQLFDAAASTAGGLLGDRLTR